MKKILLAILFVNIVFAVSAQSERYTGAMAKNLQAMGEAKTADAMLDVVNAFERIGNAEKTQWLPYYYAAVAQVWHAFMVNDPKQNDVLGDKATAFLAKAEELEKNNSEIALVKAMIATVKMMVDPMSRYMQYGAIIAENTALSKKLDPNNPRPYMWEAQGISRTPEQFGGGCGNAKPVFEEATKRFETFKPASVLHPNWGKEQNAQAYAACK
ncbi:hypothetical protein ESA94_13050 [Lacibacter luteus]|uniref:Uncharacterized protein n=1 Tax=Lacibacter luteus TaxID=2508719 RepID=A0A4Q1CIS2_9BACT|nr:hypothetical protein [Lacibacter luteus]RXK59969.1 hypothetical protein ESA94_13050 [Lacibacter luteus]